MKSIILLSLCLLAINSHALKKGDYTLSTESLCHGYPKVGVNTPEGYCVGLVASSQEGLKRPRRILALDDGDFIITDMVGWVANKGIVWRFHPPTNTLTKVFENVDHAHGLGLGPDGLVYVGTRGEIFRFDPKYDLADEKPSKEVVISDLPATGNHPLTHFIFDQIGNLIVNVGAPSDQCLNERGKPQIPCPESEGENPEAVLRKYTKESGYKSFSILAKGLRNSMALAIEPMTGQLLQGENGMDFKELETPREEINLITPGRHYGWPYCYEDGLLNPKYKKSFFNRLPKIDCQHYESPVAHLPPHSAPLDMMFYQGEMFKELQGKLIVSLHGYRETGHRIVTLDLNEQFLPYDSSKAEIVNNWSAENINTPKGSPVGMTIAKDGSIWLVEDKNKTILVIAKGESSDQQDSQQEEQLSWEDLKNSEKDNFFALNNDIFQKTCVACHSQFNGAPSKIFNELVAQNLLRPGSHSTSPIYQRIINSENGTQMPIGSAPVSPKLANKLKVFINALK